MRTDKLKLVMTQSLISRPEIFLLSAVSINKR